MVMEQVKEDVVLLIHVGLLQSVKLPPCQGTVIHVKLEDGWSKNGHVIVENDCEIELGTGVLMRFCSLLMMGSHRSPQVIEEDSSVGKADCVSPSKVQGEASTE